VAWLLQRSYKPPKGSVPTDGIETLALRFHLPRRFAARKSTSLAHVDVSCPAAASSSARWASVSRIRSSAALRSSGGLGGRPIRGCFSMNLNVATKTFASTLAMPTLRCYNKWSRKEKTPGSVGTRPGADSTGFRLIEPK
jgi:hypothetical protein